MNQNSPDFYVESSEESLKETERLVLHCAVLLRTNVTCSRSVVFSETPDFSINKTDARI
jgi:hypothetical protein